ncbi:glycosyltransferase [Clostridium aciditolerans]|uniref:Glycosyltransferase n=1 Tax=Clostridium aciditolerans TaxID=339861 RepID=A0A934HVA9_9CLOT|nr:glycosyltransferase [Clostridium aciditolerans]MBI6872049.1 glycosyltransferase [Clostridium aciditolerans]
MNKDTLYVVLPCYNEEDNIENLIKAWNMEERKLFEKGLLLKFVIVDDGSGDNTLNIAERLKKSYSNITILKHKENKGLGEAINTGISYAVSQEEKGYLCIMDSDMTHEPYYIFSMVNKLKKEKLHCVIASRYRKGSKIEGLSLYRKLLSYGARIVYTLTLRIPNVRDYTCGYRLYTLESLRTLSEKHGGKLVAEKGFACMMELLVRINNEGFKIAEVPFVLKYQLKGGASKMNVWRTVSRSLILLARL